MKWLLMAVLIYLLAINLYGFKLMGEDKAKSIRKQWRIPEKKFFLVSLLGGSLGTWAGMYLYRHKTKHWYFVTGIPLILFLQTAVVLVLLNK